MGFNAYRCERCGKYYDRKSSIKFSTISNKASFAKSIMDDLCEKDVLEICDNCIKEFMIWFDISKDETTLVSYTPTEVRNILIEEGQEYATKYGFKLGDTIKFSPTEVEKILKAGSDKESEE